MNDLTQRKKRKLAVVSTVNRRCCGHSSDGWTWIGEHTDKVFKRLLLSINTQMSSAEQRIIAKLEEIDTTLSIISREIARHADDPQSEDVGHRH